MTRSILVAAAAASFALTAPASAQLEPAGFEIAAPNLDSGLAEWRADHGASWRLRRDAGTGHAAFLYGGQTPAASQPRSDADYASLALEYVARARGLMGIDPTTLGEPAVHFLPLGFGGSTDKVAVSFDQVVGGIPVRRGNVNALLSMEGALLSLDTTGLPNLDQFVAAPARAAALARAQAVNAFVERHGLAPTEVGEPRLIIEQETAGKTRVPALAYEIDVRFEDGPQVLVRRYSIAATGPGRILRDQDQVHFFDVGGQVLTNATPGTLPDLGSNPETAVPAAYLRVDSAAGSTFTDENGFFNFPGVDGPLDVTVQYEGLYNDVAEDVGNEYSLTQSLTGTGNTMLMNPGSAGTVTSQSNVFTVINDMRDWIRAINPTDGAMDFVNTSEVNEDFVDFGFFSISNCNAFYDGSSTNYFLPGGGCVNTAYSTVIAHEQGHWLNDRYGSGNGPDGFGEGNADVFAMYLFDNPIVGDGFSGSGSNIRSGLNNLQYCGDGNGGCYGAVHTDGQVHMGAMWKMRSNLQSTHGAALGGLIADQLFSGWMNTYDQGSIDSVIEIQLLTLDDNDGNIDNGTPNYADINDAYLAQGFPGFELALIGIDSVVTVESTLDEAGPYGFALDAESLVGGNIASVELRFDAGAGEQTIGMADDGSGTYTALIPGVPSPATVEYYAVITDNVGNVAIWPEDGATTPERFNVGQFEVYFAEDFEGPGDEGWTHFEIATQDDWQRGVPAGKGGSSSGIAWNDPPSAAQGLNAWGNDLGPDGFNGAYQPDVHNFLRSPVIDLSGATGATLRFQRWLTVEEAIFDQAQIRLNGAVVWENPQNGNLVDTEWTEFELDISSADGDPTAELEFRLITDGGLNLGGWNIDDLSISSLDASPTFGQPSIYGSGVSGTGGLTPTLDSKGQPAQLGNADFVVAIKNGRPNAAATLAVGVQSTDIPLAGGSLLVVPALVGDLTLDQFGQAATPVPLTGSPALVGQTLFVQAFVDDPAAPFGFAFSAGLAATVVN